MQPRTLAIVITLLPLLAVNGGYLMSAWNEHVDWCIPYIHGCTTISKVGRSEDIIFMFRATMMIQAVLLIWFWLFIKRWLDLLNGRPTSAAKIICWLGSIGAVFLILYIDFLGTEGEMNRLMRRYGVTIFFTFTPLAQLLTLKQLFKLEAGTPTLAIDRRVLNYQLILLLLVLIIGIASLVINYTGNKTYESENIVEWNIYFLTTVYFAGYIVLWKNLRMNLIHKR
jgi:hypothetical protein